MYVGISANVTNVYYIERKLAMNMQILAVSVVSGGLYCNCNVNSGTEIYTANLIFTW